MRAGDIIKFLFSLALCLSLGMPGAAQAPIKAQNWLSGYNPWAGEWILGSHWISSHEMVTLIPGTLHLTYLDINTGRQVPLDVINAWVDHRRQSSNGYGSALTRLSPNGKWLLWPSGDAEKPTWIASTLDGSESREWPRHTSISNPAVAWMQDSTHWVELSMAEDWAADGRTCGLRSDDARVRVYSLEMRDVQEFPLQMAPESVTSEEKVKEIQVNFFGSDFSFTTDGHGWVTSAQMGEKMETANGRVKFIQTSPEIDSYQLLPGPEYWTLRATHMALGPANFQKQDVSAGIPDFCYRSPDDRWLLYQHRLPRSSTGEGVDELVLCRTNGSEQRAVYRGNPCHSVEWMPDGRGFSFIVPVGNGATPTELYTVSLDQLDGKQPSSKRQQMARRSAPQGPFPTSPNGVGQMPFKQLASRSKMPGKPPTASSPALLASKPLMAKTLIAAEKQPARPKKNRRAAFRPDRPQAGLTARLVATANP